MIQRLKIDSDPSLEKDVITNAIVSTDTNAYNVALMRKTNRNKYKEDITTLKTEVAELTNLVKILVEKLDK